MDGGPARIMARMIRAEEPAACTGIHKSHPMFHGTGSLETIGRAP
jgi:hypothetical protein